MEGNLRRGNLFRLREEHRNEGLQEVRTALHFAQNHESSAAQGAADQNRPSRLNIDRHALLDSTQITSLGRSRVDLGR